MGFGNYGNVKHQLNLTSVTDRLFSPALWYDCPRAGVILGEVDGYRDGDDFKWHTVEDGNDDATLPMGYQRYIDTSNTIRLAAATATNPYGTLALVTDATDNDGPVIHRVVGTNAASSVLAPFFIGNGINTKLWFEARVKKSSVTDNQCAFALGLIAGIHSAVAADNGVLSDNAGDIVDSVSFIGFRALHDNGEELDFAWQDSAQTAPEEVANIHTLVADTYVKLGFKYDYSAPGGKRIKLYVNNREYSTYVTATNIAASTFPEDDMMGFVFATKNGEATATTGTIDWWECVQVYE
jgi:hypothetical protein